MTTPSSMALTGSAATDVTVRPLSSLADCHAAVDLQRDVWGHDYQDLVPASLFQVVGLVGGLAIGAFDADGALLGYAFGVTGFRDGVVVHWSHMLGVRESARDGGVGRLLKHYQRTALARLGVVSVFWTFDPLQAKNAYFNLRCLGAHVDEYVPNMYGDTGSSLHLGLPTDRLIIHVSTADDVAPQRPLQPLASGPILTAFPRADDVGFESLADARPSVALIEIPLDIREVSKRSPKDALTWRLSVRRHFQWALSDGYRIVDLDRDATAGRAFYVVMRP